MKILSMTATFGKLENQTLTLQPGLNILSAPNEWGKSTWCAFLVTMLYGLDTREKTTKTTLAVKERYAPWSGSPMSGRLDIECNGRNITIERWTKGRTPMGEFRAYETQSGLAVEGLTGANCGEMLLGVERSVFLRAGFLRLSDLPVTADESLRRRLNALVTTGDESGAADALAQKLKDLKNKCRANRTTGLIPQAEKEREYLQEKLTQLRTLQQQSRELQAQKTAQEALLAQLENHLQALQYDAAQENIRKVEQAHMDVETAAGNMARLEDACVALPSRENALADLLRHSQLVQTQAALVQEWNILPPEPPIPQIPERYRGMEPEDAICQAREDAVVYGNLEKQPVALHKILYLFLGIVAICVLLGLLVKSPWFWGAMILTIVVLFGAMLYGYHDQKNRRRKEMDELRQRYPGIPPEMWAEDATMYAEGQRQYDQMLENALALRRDIRQRMDENEQAMQALTGGLSSRDFLQDRNEIIRKHDALTDARKEHKQAAAHAAALGTMLKPVQKPEIPDTLTCSEGETRRLLEDTDLRLKHLQLRLGQCQGNMDALGSENAITDRLAQLDQRLRELTNTYNALDKALLTLDKATAQLQRRFAPRISQQAQEIFCKLTGGRYDRLNLQQDLSVNAATAEEITMRACQWRSEGTIDQLYLALRLAVAQELTPNAPLVLDDVLVRFDDGRHAAAMEILHQQAQHKQVILFTCQSREK